MSVNFINCILNPGKILGAVLSKLMGRAASNVQLYFYLFINLYFSRNILIEIQNLFFKRVLAKKAAYKHLKFHIKNNKNTKFHIENKTQNTIKSHKALF